MSMTTRSLCCCSGISSVTSSMFQDFTCQQHTLEIQVFCDFTLCQLGNTQVCLWQTQTRRSYGSSCIPWPWRWGYNDPLKCHQPFAIQDSIMSKKTWTFSNTAKNNEKKEKSVVLLSIGVGCYLLCNIFNVYLLIYCSFDSINIVIS